VWASLNLPLTAAGSGAPSRHALKRAGPAAYVCSSSAAPAASCRSTLRTSPESAASGGIEGTSRYSVAATHASDTWKSSKLSWRRCAGGNPGV